MTIRSLHAVFFTLCITSSFVSGQAAANDQQLLEPGLWEVKTMTGTMGMPSDLPPVPITQNRCFTKETIADVAALPALSGIRGECQLDEAPETDEGVTHWNMQCADAGRNMQVTAELHTASSVAYVGKVYFVETREEQRVNGQITVHGKWLGACSETIQTVKHQDAITPTAAN